MSMLSLDKFVALVERSQLIAEDRLAQAVVDWKRGATLRQLDDAQYCADHLVELGLLTPWQSGKLLEGRHRGFFLGKYKLLDHLGSGGMSSVYLAEHVLMQRRVAIKVLPHNRVGDSSHLARFHFEAQAAAALDHRNIVRAYDLDNEDKIHYLVMEYVEGRDLDAIVSQDGPLDYHTAADVVAQAAAGLDHAHHASLVHRDIKPANLLVDRKGTVKILDMGLAKSTNQTGRAPQFVQDEQVLGTADYLAPEQAINSRLVDHRADIYSLGCTLYFLLTGHPPFAEGTSLERMTAHQREMPPSVLLDRPDAPATLVAICRRMMEKAPGDRYQSASDVHQALTAWLESEQALGRVSATMLALAGRTSSGVRQQGKSKANLVSGSASDLNPPSSESSQFPPSLQDTDSNLRSSGTEKIPIELTATTSESSRALPPPIASPPREAPRAAPLEPVRPLLSPANTSRNQQAILDLAREERASKEWLQRASRASGSPSWMLVGVLSGLILIAIAALLAAVAR